MRFSSSRRSQSVIEYILILTAVSVVLITGILVKGGVFVKGVNAVLSLPGARIDAANSLMNFAAATAPASSAMSWWMPRRRSLARIGPAMLP